MKLETLWREEDGGRLASTVWRTGDGYRMISSAMLGGGIGAARWVLNAQVPGAYSRTDPVAHLAELAAAHGLDGPGVGMLTAASVSRTMRRDDGGVHVSATVGLRVPTWAASPAGTPDPELAPLNDSSPRAWTPGTVNIVVAVPVPLSDAALVNAVGTATEAKTQALLEAGFPCTGTASDAICIAATTGAVTIGAATTGGGTTTGAATTGDGTTGAVATGAVATGGGTTGAGTTGGGTTGCGTTGAVATGAGMTRAVTTGGATGGVGTGGGVEEVFAGPRSTWGARIARAVHAAVHAGALDYARHLEGRD
jgi:adenosylcobinamide amidohydrolase